MHERLMAALAAGVAMMMLVAGIPASAQVNPDDLLPVEEAFALQARGGDDEVRLVFRIAEGYYMYRHAFGFEPVGDDVALGEAIVPD
ncbi:MAG: protein-disulfide reductase DsbD N-terminal domain-containing protein, partial [Wenzhouxiangella sp.]